MNTVAVTQGTSPVVLAFPHSSTCVPPKIMTALNDTGRRLSDTDWHLHRLYAGLLPQATMVSAQFHRYVVDANRDPSGQSLYPGQATTGLIPETDFDGNPIRLNPVDNALLQKHTAQFHAPYHAALRAELNRVRAVHGHAILYDCHSIRSIVPRLFDGVLSDLNIGTFDGASCAPALTGLIAGVTATAPAFTTVTNGRFKGGWTTRHYGDPGRNIHAIQMELAQSTHLKTEHHPWEYDPEKASTLRAVLGRILNALHDWKPK